MKTEIPQDPNPSCGCPKDCECHQPRTGGEPESRPGRDEHLLGLEAAVDSLEKTVANLRAEQQQFLERYISLEEQNSALTTLYVACQRLHSSLDRSEILLTVREIIANLIGCEEYRLFSLRTDGWLVQIDSFGVPAENYQRISSTFGLIGHAVQSGQIFIVENGFVSVSLPLETNLTACIPLKRNGKVTGAIALFRLLPQKFELQELDRELFRLLETHLALALYCAEQEQYERARTGAQA